MPQNNLSKKNNLVKQEAKLLKARNKCRRTRCARELKESNKLHKSFEKEQASACGHIKDDKKYFDCTSIFFDGSEYKKKFDAYSNCGNPKCKKINNSLKKIQNQQIKEQMQLMH